MSTVSVPSAGLEEVVVLLAAASRDLRELRSDFNRLQSEFNDLKAEVAAGRQSEFEFVPSAREEPSSPVVSAGDLASSSLAAATTLLAGPVRGPAVPPERLAIARGVGQWLRRNLEGGVRGLSGREKIPLQSRVYIVIRDFDLNVFNPPKIFFAWHLAKPLCYRGGSAGDSIFIGLPSKKEAFEALLSGHFLVPEELRQ